VGHITVGHSKKQTEAMELSRDDTVGAPPENKERSNQNWRLTHKGQNSTNIVLQ